MTLTMDLITTNEQVTVLNQEVLLTELTIQQLIDLALDSVNERISIQSRQELINRGKDNIHDRIKIKKCCKSAISNLELLLKKSDEEDFNQNKIKSHKTKFLASVSVLDKLQLEWQKYDLNIKH